MSKSKLAVYKGGTRKLEPPEYVTRRYLREKLHEEGLSLFQLSCRIGVTATTLRRWVDEAGVELFDGRGKAKRPYAPDVTPKCLPALIRAIDRADSPPRTEKQAQSWVERWQNVERKINPGHKGEVTAQWITVQDILTIVRTQKYRDPDYVKPGVDWPRSVVERIRAIYLQHCEHESRRAIARRVADEMPQFTFKQVHDYMYRHKWRKPTVWNRDMRAWLRSEYERLRDNCETLWELARRVGYEEKGLTDRKVYDALLLYARDWEKEVVQR